MTVLFVTHQPEDARRIADNMVFLEDGAVAAAGPTDTFFGKVDRRRSGAISEHNIRTGICPEADIIYESNRIVRAILCVLGGTKTSIRANARASLAGCELSTERKLCCRCRRSAQETNPAVKPLPRASGAAAGLAALARRLPGAFQPVAAAIEESAFRPSEQPVTVDSVSRNDRLAELARAQHPRILATYGGEYSDPKLERMVAKVVGNLTTVSGNPGQAYRITILNSPNVNAFALPGGYLYVTRGLLALANDSAELAAVIAHEMGHVTANHGLQRQQKEAEEALATKVVTDVLGASSNTSLPCRHRSLQLWPLSSPCPRPWACCSEQP